MGSPVPKGLRTREEALTIPSRLRDHVEDLSVTPLTVSSSSTLNAGHPAKYANGLSTTLIALAGISDVGDPFAGTGKLAEETQCGAIALNEIDPKWFPALTALRASLGCEISFGDARNVPWVRDTLIFSPPYYPRTDRRKLAGHDDAKRGPVVGYRSGYGCDVAGFIGDPGGSLAIISYRTAMRDVFRALRRNGRRMIIVTKNQTRLGVELRLDLDTILTAREAGWICTGRHGWRPRPSLWARYNQQKGTGVEIEDVLVFEREAG